MMKNYILLSIYDKQTAEFVPVGVFRNMADMMEAKRNCPRSSRWKFEYHKIPVDAIDMKVIKDYSRE